MNCQEALRLLYDIIDKEASEIDEQEVQEHLVRCQHCSQVYRFQGQIHDFILARARHENPGPQLDSLKSRVLDVLEKEDRAAADPFGSGGGRKAAPPAKTIVRVSRYVAAAAALVVLVWSAFAVSDIFRHQADYNELEQQHFAAESSLNSFASSNLTDDAVGTCTRDLQYSLHSEVNGFTLVGGRMETIDGTRMAHFVYRNTTSGDVISVFVIPDSKYEIPEDVQQFSVSRNGRTFFDHHCRGCRLVYHRDNNVVIITASQKHELDLLEFIPGSSAV